LKKFKNSEKQRKSKKICFFYIFASFLAFSTTSKKEFKFSEVFERVRLSRVVFKILDFSL